MYLLKVLSGSHHVKRKKYSKGQTFRSHLPLHLTFKNKFECLNEPDEDEDEIEEPIFLESNDDDDIPDDTPDEVVEEEVETEEEESEEEDEDEFITLPLKLEQVSARRFNVLDAKGVKVNDKKLAKKDAEALIAEYEEGE